MTPIETIMKQNKDRLKGKIWDTRYSIMITNDKKGLEKLKELEKKYDKASGDRHYEYNKVEWWDIMIRYTFWGLELIEERPYLLWLQSTGLKDKNGNLIYEGDIVKFIDYSCTPHKEVVMEVRYVNTADYGFNTFLEPFSQSVCGDKLADGRWQLTVFTTPPSDCEVLGNKFENPEL